MKGMAWGRGGTVALMVVASGLLGACGGKASGGRVNALSDRSFAGQNRCNPANALRPFIVEWDATDQSSFQAQAASDIVVVSYHGCELTVLDGCREGAVKGSLGSYRPPEFTSGGVEVVDIHDEGELYAKLPLGAESLGGRVHNGETFHMEYYVSATRVATRDRLYASTLARNPACAAATHFVHAYNLGAFALASTASLKGEVGGSFFGFGAGGKSRSESKADKRGGRLDACQGDSAREVDACKVPIRLTLREITPGDDPDTGASRAPVSDASLSVVGQLKATTDAEKRAASLLASAGEKKQARDGAGCLADLDQHDSLDPRPEGLSTSPSTGRVAGLRADCLMLAGQCEAGKSLYRRAVAATKGGEVGPEHIDRMTDAEAAQMCSGNALSERDQYLRAISDLTQGGLGVKTKTLAECQSAFDTFMRLRTVIKARDASDTSIPARPLTALGMPAPSCFARASDCAAAFRAHQALNDAKGPDDGWKARDAQALRSSFEGLVPTCKGK